MEFAEKQLAKYGWVKGKGLGRSVKGSAEPIKVRLKRDNSGVGSSAGAEFTSNWWSKVFNQAAKGINVCENVEDDSVAVKASSNTSLERTRKHYGNHRKELHYGGFLSSGAHLTGSITVHGAYEEMKSEGGGCSEEGKEEEKEHGVGVEEKIFEACGGRTAHKAARHGCKLNGKLQRLEDQEKALEEEIILGSQEEPAKRRKKRKREESSCVENKSKEKKRSKHKHKYQHN